MELQKNRFVVISLAAVLASLAEFPLFKPKMLT